MVQYFNSCYKHHGMHDSALADSYVLRYLLPVVRYFFYKAMSLSETMMLAKLTC